MSFVAINVLTVPPESGPVLEERFAGRAGTVEQAPGFEHFEVLRPVSGTDSYLVYTRWASREDFEAWSQSQSFRLGHGRRGRATEERDAASGSTIWGFDVVISHTAE